MTGTLYTRTKICSLLFLTVLLEIVQRCDSGVVVSLRLGRFINPGGSCCNVRHGQCEPCYYEFQVCATRLSGYAYTSTGDLFCDYGRWNTGVIRSREDSSEDSSEDSFFLPSRFPSGHPNPLKIQVPYWEGRIRVTINVRDVGMWGYRNDPVSEYIFSLSEWTPGRTELESLTRNWLFVRYGLRLDVQYAVYCQPNFYGHFCRGHCQPPTYYDQYTCDTNTGRKICHRGYTGYNCKQKILPTTSYPWWRTTTRRPLPPRRLITTVAPIITSTESTSSSSTTITTPYVTTNTPASTTKSLTSTTHTFISTTRPPFSTTETPTSTPQTPTSTTDTPTSTTDTRASTTHTPSITATHMPTPSKHILTSAADTPTSTTDTITSTVDTPSSTSHNSTSATVTHTSITSTPTSTTYTPTLSPKGTTQDAKTTKIVASTAQTTPPQKITTIGKKQATTAISISNTTPSTPQSPKATPTTPASSTLGPSTLIGEYVTTEIYSTNARTDANVTAEHITYRANDSAPPNTQSSSAAYLKSLTTVFDQYVTTDTVSSETRAVSSSIEYSEMKNKSSPSPTQPTLPGEDVSTVPDETTDPSSVATDGGYTTDFLAHTSEETYTEVSTVGESTTITASTLNTNIISVSSGQVTRRPTPKVSKKPTDRRRLKNETTTANPTSTGNPMSTVNVTNLTLPASVSMVTEHAPALSTSVSNQTDIYTNYSDIATQTMTPDSTDSKTVGSTFPHHDTSTDGMFFTDSISQTSPERASLQTVVTISNGTLTATNSTTSTSSSPSTSQVVATTVATLNFTQARQPTGLHGNDHFPIRTMSSNVCWTWKSNDVKTICNCDQRNLPKLPPIDAYWGTSLRTGKPKFILGKVTLN
eukprot:XP_001202551.2 PREDICTED: mucin-2 isoform X1 [Strongylocentrotus purpuratus]